MKRKRLREGWPVLVHQYGLMTTEDIPNAWAEEHGKYVRCWNTLIDVNKELSDEYHELFAANEKITELNTKRKELSDLNDYIYTNIKKERARSRKKTTPETKRLQKEQKPVRDELKEVRAILKEHKDRFKEKYKPAFDIFREKQKDAFKKVIKGAKLYWAHSDLILQDFYKALIKSFGSPKYKSANRKDINFIQRYTNGGVPAPTIFSKNNRCWIEPVEELTEEDKALPQRQWKRKLRTKVHFSMCGEELVFRCVFHRPLPKNAIVKQLTLHGKRNGTNIQRWLLGITVEVPEIESVVTIGNKRIHAAMDIGWRKVEDAMFRYGCVLDESERFQYLLLPPKFKEMAEEQKIYNRKLADIVNMLKEMDKAQYIDAGVDPHLFKNWHVANIGRFHKIAHQCKETALFGEITPFLQTYNEIRTQLNNDYGQLTRYRRWLYYNMAHDMCQDYKTIAIERLKVSKMLQPNVADKNGKEKHEAAQKYAKLIAPAEWLSILKKVAVKTDTTIIEKDPANTTLKCHACGHKQIMTLEERIKLVWECQLCESVWDQDINAAINLFE